MDQEALLQASLIEQQARELEENLEYIDQQALELESFEANIDDLSKSKENTMLASLGKGVYTKVALLEKDLFVEVGSGVIVKKTPEELSKVINNQIRKMRETRAHLSGQLDICNASLNSLLHELEKSKKD